MSSKQELIDKQPRFWGLIAGGSTLTAACEAVESSSPTTTEPDRSSAMLWRHSTEDGTAWF